MPNRGGKACPIYRPGRGPSLSLVCVPYSLYSGIVSTPTKSRLTTQTSAGGCASKLSPKILDQVLGRIPRRADENVLVGYDTADDAGVYKLTPELALVQTVDFFTPIVDDPYTFGAIAAANALSDVYAMGGKPVSALSILAYPANGDSQVLEEIVK